MKKRIEWIDSLKGFTIILVVIGHVAKGFLDANAYTECTGLMQGIYNVIYSFHMPLFIIISGILFQTSYVLGEGCHTTLKKDAFKSQVLNLVCLYVFYSLLLGVLKIIFSSAVNEKTTPLDLLMIWAKPIQLYWYLYVLIILYLIFSIGFFRNARKYGLLLFGLGVISAASSYFSLPDWFQIPAVLFYAFFFYLGNKLFMLRKYKTLKILGLALGIAALIGLILMLVIDIPGETAFLQPIIEILIALGMSLLLICIFAKVKWIGGLKPLVFFGKYCLEIYLLHTFFATAFRALFLRIGIASGVLALVLTMIISLFGPIGISLLLKKIHLHTLAFSPYKYFSSRRRHS